MSSGLIYAPGIFSSISELAVLASEVADYGGIYSSLIRNEGAGLLDSVSEAIEVGKRSGATVHVSHLKATGSENYGLVVDAFALLDTARSGGTSAYCDVYPYTAGSTFLAMVTPGWAQEGGFDELVRRLGSNEVRARIRRDMLAGLPGWNSIFRAVGDWDGIVISSVGDRALAAYEGHSVSDLASRDGKDPFEWTFDLLVADRGATVMVIFLMDERDVHDVITYPWSVIGSDQLLVTGRERKTHPRAYGSFAKVIGPLVRDAALFPLETAVHKMTGLPASILGMSDRGGVAAGMVADLVVFDAESVTDCATYASPALAAAGIEIVFMSGGIAFERGEATVPGLGKVLRKV